MLNNIARLYFDDTAKKKIAFLKSKMIDSVYKLNQNKINLSASPHVYQNVN